MILYLGLDPTNWTAKTKWVHYPVIATKRAASEEIAKACALWPSFTHVIFTSRRSVVHWWEVESRWGEQQAIAIGEGTAGELRRRGVEPKVAPESTQEGVIALLKTLDLREGFLFLPRSSRARGALTHYLEQEKIRHLAIDLYQTVFQRGEPVPDLAAFDEIVFTSVSTVEAFLQIYGSLPRHCKLTAIGPITEQTIAKIISTGYTRLSK